MSPENTATTIPATTLASRPVDGIPAPALGDSGTPGNKNT